MTEQGNKSGQHGDKIGDQEIKSAKHRSHGRPSGGAAAATPPLHKNWLRHPGEDQAKAGIYRAASL
jgi:hypothetical protein